MVAYFNDLPITEVLHFPSHSRHRQKFSNLKKMCEEDSSPLLCGFTAMLFGYIYMTLAHKYSKKLNWSR